MVTPEMLAETIEKIRGFGEAAERDLSGFPPGLFIFAAVHADGERAREMATARLGRQYAQDFSKLTSKYALAGTPAECRARLREYVDAGARFVMLSSVCPDEYIDANVRLLAEEVIPEFR
jgi:alkanesulfonate monooxygenase SsuD/methylene tetrahydromethanopterin reductase-like flavin-dependent oxidoreductase (luciferase family)